MAKLEVANLGLNLRQMKHPLLKSLWTCWRPFVLVVTLLSPATMMAQQRQALIGSDLYHLMAKDPQQIFPVLITGDASAITSALLQSGSKPLRIYKDVVRADVNASQIRELREAKGVQRLDCPQGKLHILNDVMLQQNNADSAQMGYFPLEQGYDGSGVVIGIIDAPFDYRHHDFTDSLGNTRIQYLWDQNLPDDGSSPDPYTYGIECDSQSIADETCPHIDYTSWYSHGSGVAGIAASSGNAAGVYKGIAPNADLIFVSLNFEDDFLTSVLDAIDYVFNKADELGKPCVINTSFGVYAGSHDAGDITAQTIESMLDEQAGRVIVAAAGNAGNQLIHLGYDVTPEPHFTWFKKLSYASLVYWQLWADTAQFNNVEFAVGADNPTGWVSKGSSPFFNILDDFDTELGLDSLIYTLVSGATTIGTMYFYAEEIDGKYMLECYIVPSFTNYNWRLTTQGSGRFDLWGMEGFTGYSNFVTTGLPSVATFPDISQYILPDTKQSTVSSWQCSDKVITVGSYVNRDTMTNYYGDNPPLVDTVGQLFYSSSRGPTRDGRTKPDITSTGARVLTTGSSVLTDWLIGLGAANYISADGQHYLQNGTSFASPAVTGIAALYLQKNPTATYSEVKTAITGNARRDDFTGYALPDNDWGFGKADAFRTLTGNWGCDSSNYMDPPTGITLNAATTNAAFLEWDLVPAALLYQLSYVPVSGGSIQRKKALTNSRALTGLSPGTTYSVKIRTSCEGFGYSAWSAPFLFSTLPLRSGDIPDGFSVFPNPAGNQVTVQLPADAQSIRLFNAQGLVCKEWSVEHSTVLLDINGLPGGCYLLEVTGSMGMYREQLLILN
jgi:subtilisin family serine protease